MCLDNTEIQDYYIGGYDVTFDEDCDTYDDYCNCITVSDTPQYTCHKNGDTWNKLGVGELDICMGDCSYEYGCMNRILVEWEMDMFGYEYDVDDTGCDEYCICAKLTGGF